MELVLVRKLLILIFSFLLLLFIGGCSKSETGNEMNEYVIPAEIHSLNINWRFGTIHFIDSTEFKIQESSSKKIKDSEKLSYSMANGGVDINYTHKSSRDLTIYLNKINLFQSITIKGDFVDITMENMNLGTVDIQSNLGTFLIEDCKIQSFKSKIECDNRYVRSKINNSEVEDCYISYHRINEFYLTDSTFKRVKLDMDYSHTFIRRIAFSEINLYQTSGGAFIELNGNLGYTFDIQCRDLALDMETVQYNTLYFYKTGEHKVNITGTASIDIRRYFA